ncbi:hypothetical protein GZH46_02947, partial [Fragariocoptes setiger]
MTDLKCFLKPKVTSNWKSDENQLQYNSHEVNYSKSNNSLINAIDLLHFYPINAFAHCFYFLSLVALSPLMSSAQLISITNDSMFQSSTNVTVNERPHTAIDEPCNSSSVCTSIAGDHWGCTNGTCRCVETYKLVDSLCVYTGGKTERKFRAESILPLMIVLGIMFIGMCIALNLFSRARFKKNRNAFIAGRVPKRSPPRPRGRASISQRSLGRATPNPSTSMPATPLPITPLTPIPPV